ncbi:sensor protein rcsC [Westerdykella ornata]|uniref:histidine kinase n=1 Tax=Westerdykella ornata TaxID=318751 RepID=A0A6A6JWD1_WESOR|nr:sensor protein rcsC [Westerdykella ornata]KAF2280912.1 sensor protein rcsC [Westerdykella ornata]
MSSSMEPPDISSGRQTLRLLRPQLGLFLQNGQSGFKEELRRFYSPAESNAAEELVKLKDTLRRADNDSFWPILAEGLATIAAAQYAFVSKRILVDDGNDHVETPPTGELSCHLVGAAFCVNDGHGTKHQVQHFKYHAYSCPCAYMRHDKIFSIPEKLNDFIMNNPNDMVGPGESYLGIPLFADGKCFAHFGVMWSADGAARRVLGWGYLELLMRGLEDLILDRVLQGKRFAASTVSAGEERPRVIPHAAIPMSQSLKPYARSLSHELRTPMQGVVGMLDVMMANVKEAAEGLEDIRLQNLLATLKDNIETVQDSSRRAVEAADNIVHAYDMNMGLPEDPDSLFEELARDNIILRDRKPDIVVTGNTSPNNHFRGTKRRRQEFAWRADEISTHARVCRMPRRRIRQSLSEEPQSRATKAATLAKQDMQVSALHKACSHEASDAKCDNDSSSSPLFASEHSTVPGLRHTDLREVIRYVINDALKVGGRPDSAIAEETEYGERIEVRTRRSSGQVNIKHIEWTVAPDVPQTILIDEKDLAKTISCIMLNAIKFTDNGEITLGVTLGDNGRRILVNVKDTGSGIPAAFLPNLFKPFAREDNSTTRESEGLGLGLLVAKGLARKLGGDLSCIHSDVAGPRKGSEFELCVPLTPGDACCRSSSPFGSPTLSANSMDAEVLFTVTQQPGTPPLSSEISRNGQRLSPRSSPALSATSQRSPSLAPLGIHLPTPRSASPVRPRATSKTRTLSDDHFDRSLAARYPLNFLVVEDNKINRKLLVSMLAKLGYKNVAEAYDGNNAVEQMRQERSPKEQIDVVLMDLWMPLLDGFQATETILKMDLPKIPTILAVSADVTGPAIDRTEKVGMKGFLGKPFRIQDLEKLIVEHCSFQLAA